MKKINNILITALLIFSFSGTMVFANTPEESAPIDYVAIDDGADLLTQSEEEELLKTIQEYKSEYGFDVTLITRSSIGYQDVLVYADDYEGVDEYADGLVFLVDMEQREYATSTRNSAISAFNDEALDKMDEILVKHLGNEDYFIAFTEYLKVTEDVLIAANNNEVYKEEFNLFSAISAIILEGGLVGLIFAAFVAGMVNSYLKNEMNTAVKSTNADHYIDYGSFNLKSRSDRFIHQTITKVPKPRDNQSSGGARVRTNSGGFSRGGRKGGF